MRRMRWLLAGVVAAWYGAAAAGPDAMVRVPAAADGSVRAFWIDRAEVTNERFAAFVAETGYVTTAERPVEWSALRRQVPPGTPKPPEEALAPGSLVFVQPEGGTAARGVASWWRWTPGACWRTPEGPGSGIEERMDHPVVHVSREDALAFCAWAGTRLPSEAEWEHAARGGIEGGAFPWGDGALDGTRANVWQGRFPAKDLAEDGFSGTAPVGSFPANGYGLVDTAGNVWEWTATRIDPADDGAAAVIRGGSFLCHGSYCAGYRLDSRQATSPDTGLSHLGFRCVKDDDGRR